MSDVHVGRSSLDQLFDGLCPQWPDALRDEALAARWAEALRATPDRPSLRDEASQLLEAFPGQIEVVRPLCEVLIQRATGPVDEPPRAPEEGALAAEAAGRCLGKLSKAQRLEAQLGGVLHALEGNALRTLGPKRLDAAAESLGRAIEVEPRAAWWFDLGLVHKDARDWDRSLQANERVLAQARTHRGALFNYAVAATALGRGQDAAEAWRAAGIPAESKPRSLPFVPGLPPAQVRVSTVGSGHQEALLPTEAAGFEALWVQPLSPCHGVVRSPTHREANVDFGDLVLWDPAPVVILREGEDVVPRFALLGVLRPGDERRFRFLALQQEAGQVRAIGASLPDGVILYPHGERVELVCPRCASGDLFVKHEHEPAERHRIVFGKLIVPASLKLPEFARHLESARKAQPGVLMAIPGLYEELGQPAQAGKHHKRWGMIERTVGR